jgi:CRISPR-associated exonuclease Cas4
MCLEEMLGLRVPAGAIYYRGSQRRREVSIDQELRALVRTTVASVRAMLAGDRLPPAVNDARCPSCSLFDICLPQLVAHPRRARLLQTGLFRPVSEPGAASAQGED